MRDKILDLKKNYIVVFSLLIASIIVVFCLLSITKSINKSSHLEETKVEKKTTTTITTKTSEEEKIVATNFSSGLRAIVGDLKFIGDYNIDVLYSGAKFYFNCTKFDSDKNICLEGSAKADFGTSILPLYTFKNKDENYLNRLDDYHLILSDNYIILTTSKTGKKSGDAKIYSRDGKYIDKIDNVILGYKKDKKIYNSLFPELDKDDFIYHVCDDNAVKIARVNLKKIDEINYLNKIENATCY